MDDMKDGKFTITVGRPSCGDGREFISITVRDTKSRVRFLGLEIGYSEYAQLMTGLSEVHCDGQAVDLHKVGKKKVSKKVSFELPCSKLSDRELASIMINDYLIDGYESHSGFSSQGSLTYNDGKTTAHTIVFKWE